MAYSLGFIGAGNMAEAIARGVISARLLSPDQIIASDVAPARQELFKSMGVECPADNLAVARDSEVVILSVKPQMMKTVLADLHDVLSPSTLVISIAAGISSKSIELGLGTDKPWRVIRTMPNTPLLVGQGMVAISAGSHATPADMKKATGIFAAAGQVIEVNEDKMDAVTAVSGSGPAYFFFLVEHMIRAGEQLGLTPEQARTLASQTARGAAEMLVNSPDTPQELRRKVTSPNGTTHAAITSMEANKVNDHIVSALHACAKRSKELGQ